MKSVAKTQTQFKIVIERMYFSSSFTGTAGTTAAALR